LLHCQDFGMILAIERKHAGQYLIHQHGKRIHIPIRTESLATDDFRCHIMRGAEIYGYPDGTGKARSQSQVDKFGVEFVPAIWKNHIARFHIPMDYIFGMQIRQHIA